MDDIFQEDGKVLQEKKEIRDRCLNLIRYLLCFSEIAASRVPIFDCKYGPGQRNIKFVSIIIPSLNKGLKKNPSKYTMLIDLYSVFC